MNDIREVDGSGEVVVENGPVDPVESPLTGFSKEMDERAVAQVMGVEDSLSTHRDQVAILVEWAKKQGYENIDDLKWIMRSLMSKLGTPPLSEKWIVRASRYAYLDLETDKMKSEQNSLMR